METINFEKIANEYFEKFNQYPPVLTTLDVENKEYLKMLQEAIKNGEPLTRNDLGEIFMPDDNILY